MRLPEPRGPLSEALFRDLATRTTLSATTIERGDRVATAGACALTDEDLQISLADCYELHSRGFDGVADDWEWDPALLRLRAALARRHPAGQLRDPSRSCRSGKHAEISHHPWVVGSSPTRPT
ncbi:MAG: hypothetical protein ACXVGF_13615 [Blastococcus sp.]